MNTLTKPPSSWQPHHFRHLLSGSLAFFGGVAVSFLIEHTRHHIPQRVRWDGGELQAGFKGQVFEPGPFTPTNQIEIGAREDGSLVWRKRKQ